MNNECYQIGVGKSHTFDKHIMWLTLVQLGVTEETLHVVCAINGFSEETMCDILYAVTGERDFSDYVTPCIEI